MDTKSQNTLHASFDLVLNDNWEWYINDKRIKRKHHESLGDEFYDHSNLTIEHCPFCRIPLKRNWHSLREKSDDFEYEKFILKFCIKCAYWKFSGLETSQQCMDAPTNIIATSLAAKFEKNSPDGCSSELAQYIIRNPHYLNEIRPQRLETLVADIFKQNYKHCEVRHVGRPGDLGVDVLFIDNEQTKWLIQVKRREKPEKPEGFSTLQSILGTLALTDEKHGIIVSTSGSFSRALEKQRGVAMDKGYIIKLIDKPLLTQMVGSLVPNTPWKDFFLKSSASKTLKKVQDKFLSIKLEDFRIKKEQGKQTDLFSSL
jgi:hypothetical protein